MPSVGMRRSTRVFVPKSVVKDAEGARVLRSGKRLSSECSADDDKGKGSSSVDGEVWFRLLDHSGDADDDDDVTLCCKDKDDDRWHNNVKHLDREMARGGSMNNNNNNGHGFSISMMTSESIIDDRMYGIVYNRKRRRLLGGGGGGGGNESCSLNSREDGHRVYEEDRMYGIPFVRKQRRIKRPRPTPTPTGSSSTTTTTPLSSSGVLKRNLGFLQQDLLLNGFSRHYILFLVTTSNNTSRFSCLLNSILSYMRRLLRLSELSAFLHTKSISRALALNGIHVFHDQDQDHPYPCSSDTQECGDVLESGICKIYDEAPCFTTPLFSLDFLSVPCAFMYLHFSMLLGSSIYLPDVLLRYLMGLYTKAQAPRFYDTQGCMSYISNEVGLISGSSTYTGKKEVGFVVRAPKFAAGRGDIQRKRGHLAASARAPGLSISELQSPCSVVVDADFSFLVSNHNKRRRTNSGLGEYMKEMKLTLVELRQNIDLPTCTANILVIEPYKCYREEGANVSLELSTSNEWLLAVRKQGSLRYCHKAQTVMRPSTSNRITNAMVWEVGGSGWKLEFLDRRDWLIFKELHKECYDRNKQITSVKVIPVPEIHQVVPENGDNRFIPFVRPERYINMKEDEIARALMKTTPNYDIQSDDEEFLSNLNNEFYAGENDGSECISADHFEKIIHVFEKTAYCSPDDVSDENKASNLCLNLGRREILVAIYNYWLKKRKQKRTALVRVFQCHPPRKAQLIQQPFMRKKRSFKRKGAQYRRGKQPRILQAMHFNQHKAMAEEHDIMAARQKVEEAKISARSSLEVAILKRQRAQTLMGNADLATYKATIALRLAEAIQRSDHCDAATTSFND